MAQRELNRRNIPCENSYNSYLDPTRVKDIFCDEEVLKKAWGLEEFNKVLTDDDISKLKEAVRVGIESEIPIIKYNDF